ncbi:hypothetical protein CYMTET_36658, partial [Cymbomonas tetramitiformis]
TVLGDPTEVGSVVEVYCQRSMEPAEASRLPLALGAVKANVGHMEAAAGIGSALSLLGALRAGTASPNALLRTLNPIISDRIASPNVCPPVFPREQRALAGPPAGAQDTGEVTGSASSFGFSGTLVNVVLTGAAHHTDDPGAGHEGGTQTGRYTRRRYPWKVQYHGEAVVDQAGSAQMLPAANERDLKAAVRAELEDTLGEELSGDGMLPVGGADSLLMMAVVSRMKRAFGVELPITVLFECSTVEEVSQEVQRALASNAATEGTPDPTGGMYLTKPCQHAGCIYTLRAGSSSVPPIVLVPGGIGLGYGEQLLPFLAPDQPVLMIQAPEVVASSGVPYGHFGRTVQERAAAYCRAVLSAQKVAPEAVILTGYSVGGLVAFEMAKWFLNADIFCSLTLLDPPPPGARFEPEGSSLARLCRRFQYLVDAAQDLGMCEAFSLRELFTDGEIRSQAGILAAVQKLAPHLPAGLLTEMEAAVSYLTDITDSMVQGYTPGKWRFPGDVVFFELDEGYRYYIDDMWSHDHRHAMQLWEKFVEGEVHVVGIQGEHFQAFKYQENAEAIAERALVIGVDACGPGHPNIALALGNLAIIKQGMDRANEALSVFQRELVIESEFFGTEHPQVATTLGNLGNRRLHTGKPEDVKKTLKTSRK